MRKLSNGPGGSKLRRFVVLGLCADGPRRFSSGDTGSGLGFGSESGASGTGRHRAAASSRTGRP